MMVFSVRGRFIEAAPALALRSSQPTGRPAPLRFHDKTNVVRPGVWHNFSTSGLRFQIDSLSEKCA